MHNAKFGLIAQSNHDYWTKLNPLKACIYLYNNHWTVMVSIHLKGNALNIDFNSPMGSTNKIRNPKSTKVIKTFQEFAFPDSWWFLNPTGRQYSFFPSFHHTYSQIKYFFPHNILFPSVLGMLTVNKNVDQLILLIING